LRKPPPLGKRREAPFLFQDRANRAEYGTSLKLAIERGWLWLHESGSYVRITPEGAGLFA
jgi:hypothetical protein